LSKGIGLSFLNLPNFFGNINPSDNFMITYLANFHPLFRKIISRFIKSNEKTTFLVLQEVQTLSELISRNYVDGFIEMILQQEADSEVSKKVNVSLNLI